MTHEQQRLDLFLFLLLLFYFKFDLRTSFYVRKVSMCICLWKSLIILRRPSARENPMTNSLPSQRTDESCFLTAGRVYIWKEFWTVHYAYDRVWSSRGENPVTNEPDPHLLKELTNLVFRQLAGFLPQGTWIWHGGQGVDLRVSLLALPAVFLLAGRSHLVSKITKRFWVVWLQMAKLWPSLFSRRCVGMTSRYGLCPPPVKAYGLVAVLWEGPLYRLAMN